MLPNYSTGPLIDRDAHCFPLITDRHFIRRTIAGSCNKKDRIRAVTSHPLQPFIDRGLVVALEWRIRAIFRDNLPASVVQTYSSLFGGTLMSAASVDRHGAEVGVGGGDKQWAAYAAAAKVVQAGRIRCTPTLVRYFPLFCFARQRAGGYQ